MSTTLTVEAHRKRFSIPARPMQPLSEVVAEVLAQLKLPDLRPEDCRLTLRGKALDLATPVRFANAGRDKLELQTGCEPVLGVQEVLKAAAPPPPTAAPPAAALPQPQAAALAATATAWVAPQARAGANSAPGAAASSQPGAMMALVLPAQMPAPAAAVPTVAAASPSIGPIPAGSAAEPNNGAAADASHPSLAIFGQRVYVFTRLAEQQAESEAGRVQEEDDTFFEFTEMDLRRAMVGQVEQRVKQEGGHLMTAVMREKEEQRRAESFGTVPIRLYLPDGTHCLQTALPATAPLSSVLTLARRALVPEAAAGTYLFTTPPRTVLKDKELPRSLYAAMMVPAAKLHVGVEASKAPAGGQLLRDDVLALVELPPQRTALMHANKPGSRQALLDAAGGSRAAGAAGSAPTAAQAGGTGAKGMPKWLKLTK